MPGVIGEAACLAVCGGGALMAYGVRGRSSTLFAPSVCRGPASRRAIAFTFDDGPSESTPELLRVLADHGVSATFFQCGLNVERLPEIACEVVRQGHEIGNHSHTHPKFYFKRPGFIRDELARAQAAIENATQASPVLFRAPFGIRWPGLGEAQRRLNLLGVMWTVIGRDWVLETEGIFRRVLPKVKNGAIVCLHDGRDTHLRPDIGPTIEAVRRLVPILKAERYRFETVSQLLCPTN
jgi:peptidoglycan/xylan/chitin deacetylase (PgdA/CDA1 family)